MFDYSLSIPWLPIIPEWYSKRAISNKQTQQQQQLIKYPFLFEWYYKTTTNKIKQNLNDDNDNMIEQQPPIKRRKIYY